MSNQAAAGTYFIIPSGYRPPHDVKCVFTFAQISQTAGGTVSVPCSVGLGTIGSDGKVTSTYSNSWYCTQVSFYAVYFIE